MPLEYLYNFIGQGDVGSQQVHTLSNLPDYTSSVVQQEKDKSVVKVETLVGKFRQLGGLSGLAYYGAFAFGDASLQDKTAAVYKDLQTLHEKYTTTFRDFESTSKDVTHQLQAAFDQLREGEQQASVNALKQVSSATAHLKTSASTLYQTTTASGTKVKQLLEDAIRIKTQHEEQRKQLEQERQNLQADIARIQKEKQNAEAAVAGAKQRAEQAKNEADRARKKKKKKGKGLKGKIKKALGKLKKYEKQERAARDEQRAHEATLKKHQAEQQEKEQRLAALESKFKDLKTDFSLVDEAIGALNNANKEIQELAVLVSADATAYWDGMQGYTNDLLETLSSTQDDISTGDAEIKIWESPAFQSRGVSLYAKWLALHQQSSYYLENTNEVKAQIASYVSIEHPSPQQAREMIQKIKSGQIAMPKNVKDEL